MRARIKMLVFEPAHLLGATAHVNTKPSSPQLYLCTRV